MFLVARALLFSCSGVKLLARVLLGGVMGGYIHRWLLGSSVLLGVSMQCYHGC